MCRACGVLVYPAYDAQGTKLQLEPCADGRYLIDPPQKRYVITSNRPTRTEWELFAREAMGAGSPRYKQHTHTDQRKAQPAVDPKSHHTIEPGVSARRVAVQLLLFPLRSRN